MERVFLGWDTPPLHLLRGYLHQHAQENGVWDLSGFIVVLPTASGTKRLLDLLEEGAAQDGLRLRPPEIITLGEFPERLYTPQRPFAGDHAQTLAWVRALEGLNSDQWQILVPQPPEPGQLEAWVDLGEVLNRLHRELSSQRLNFEFVKNHLTEKEDLRRWEVLTRLQRMYLDELDAVELWDRQTARQVALIQKEATIDRQVLIAFCVDLNEMQKAMLAAINEHVTILTAAPLELRHTFDEYGGLLHDPWRTSPIDVQQQQLMMAVGPAAQAQCLTSWLSDLGDAAACDEIAVGLADAELVPILDQRLRRLGLNLRWSGGRPIERSSPALLCELLADCLDRNGFREWARLARHVHLAEIVGDTASDGSDWLKHFDTYQSEHLPIRLDRQELIEIEKGFADSEAARTGASRNYLKELQVWKQKVDDWLRSLKGAPRSLAAWRRPLLQVIAAAYQRQGLLSNDSSDNPDAWSMTAQACERIAEAIERVTDVPPRLDRPVPATYVLRSALVSLRGQGLSEPDDAYTIRGLGWLDVPLDDHKYLVLTGMSEGVVPQSVGADPFLPGKMRKQFNLEDNDRRHARDAYALQLTLHSGRQVKFVVGRSDADGAPLAPSRLLLARPTEEIAERVLFLFAEHGPAFHHHAVLPHINHSVAAMEERSLMIPRPIPNRTVQQMSVTSFSDYIKCPYRFYLRHVLKLKPLQDQAEELDARQIGNLIHDALEAFGREPDALKNSTDDRAIFAYLQIQLEYRIKLHFGRTRNPTVEFQVEQAKQRLRYAATRQAQWASEGWQIRYVEHVINKGDSVVPGTSMPLIGRIDRIDFNTKTGKWAILDYKTGKLGKKPRQAHLVGDDEWINLQLPLYRHMAKMIDTSAADLGYFLLPPKASDTGIYLAEFSADELEKADLKAEEIAKLVLDCTFWPPVLKYDGVDDFSVICQTNAQRPVLAGEPTVLSL